MNEENKASRIGLGVTLCATAGLCVITAPFLRSFTGAPYLASSNLARRTIANHLRNLRNSSSTALRLTDLGSGNGDLVLEASKTGYSARGFELNPWLVLASRYRAWRYSSTTATFYRQCLWTTRLHDEDVVVVFGVPSMMERLGEKLQNECKSDSWIISNTFRLPGWKASYSKSGVHFYEIAPNRILKAKDSIGCHI